MYNLDELFLFIIESYPGMLVITDVAGRVIKASKSAAYWFNIPTDDIVGMSIFDIHPNPDKVRSMHMAALENGYIENNANTEDNDGTPISMRQIAFSVKNSEGTPVAVVAIIRMRGLPDSRDIKLYRVTDIARIMQTNPSTIYKWIQEGKMAAFKLGKGKGSVRVTEVSFLRFINKHMKAAP